MAEDFDASCLLVLEVGAQEGLLCGLCALWGSVREGTWTLHPTSTSWLELEPASPGRSGGGWGWREELGGLSGFGPSGLGLQAGERASSPTSATSSFLCSFFPFQAAED